MRPGQENQAIDMGACVYIWEKGEEGWLRLSDKMPSWAMVEGTGHAR